MDDFGFSVEEAEGLSEVWAADGEFEISDLKG